MAISTVSMPGKIKSSRRIILLHLLPGTLTVLLMLIAAPLLERMGFFPSLPILFVMIAPLLALGMLGFLYYEGKQLNGRFSLQGVVLYRDRPLPWWKVSGLTPRPNGKISTKEVDDGKTGSS